MKAESMAFSKIINVDQGAREHFHVPKYQREYTWGRAQWDQLLGDVLENDPGYFMGSIICVKDTDTDHPGDEWIYEVVDGQQRLTTLSLLMMAIYDRLKPFTDTYEFDDDEDKEDFARSISSLRNKLIKKKREGDYRPGELGGWMESGRMCFLRVQPSGQNNNIDDYKYLLGNVGLIKKSAKPRYFGNRLFSKAYKFFRAQLPDDMKSLLDLVGKINQLNFVYISVGSQSDAFTLFETLNNRGVPLSAIDIIKNKMLAEMEKQHAVNIDESYERWQEIVAAIPDAKDQERFLRHFYNAFRWNRSIRIDGIPRAIRSKVIAIYEKLIKENAGQVFDRLTDAALLYGKLLDPQDGEENDEMSDQLTDLDRINATPAYQILLYLFSLDSDSYADENFLSECVGLIRKFYVRRSVTDYPPTRDLDQAHIDTIQLCQKQLESGSKLDASFFQNAFLDQGVSNYVDFDKALRGPMYASNLLITRYLLIKLDEESHTREYAPDLWVRNKKDKTVWTIEHVLPQTESLSDGWVDALANGSRDVALQLQQEHVHRLGNLTLSGFNSKLATADFPKKQALSQNAKSLGHRINIGYKNGLALNRLEFDLASESHSLADAPTWTSDMIDARTHTMADAILELYRIPGFDPEPVTAAN